MWNNKAKPNRANVHKRIVAAEDALESARILVAQMAGDQNLKTPIDNALGWIGNIRLRLEKNKGKRARNA
jgi:hypothetical protein